MYCDLFVCRCYGFPVVGLSVCAFVLFMCYWRLYVSSVLFVYCLCCLISVVVCFPVCVCLLYVVCVVVCVV